MLRFKFLLVGLLLFGCDNTKNSTNYHSISATRPLGAECGLNDSATTTKRFPYFHPLGPTGGWAHGNMLVDYKRVGENTTNELLLYNFTVRGFVKFETEGSLRALTYDNVYGNVYGDCGWAPGQLDIKPTAKPVYVKLDSCFVGDGGVAMVHEVCWFPKGSQRGTIVFSSEHPVEPKQLSLTDVFDESDIGNQMVFNYRGTVQVIRDKLTKGDLQGARAFLGIATNTVLKLNPYHDAGSGRSIPAIEHHALELSTLMMIDLGLSIGTPEFNDKLFKLRQHAEQADKGRHCFLVCRRLLNLSILYQWLGDALAARSRGQSVPSLPATDGVGQGVVGSDPREILAYLKGELTAEGLTKYYSSISYHFWIAMHDYLEGNLLSAKSRLVHALSGKDSFSEDNGFELAAAATLASQL